MIPNTDNANNAATSNKKIKMIDFSEHLNNDVINAIHKERMENEGEPFDYERLIESGEMLANSDFLKNVLLKRGF